MIQRLDRPFYRRDPVTVARALLGQRLVRVIDGRRAAGVIVETEAYLGLVDEAAHSYRGRTARNASMWKEGGHAYVYFIYGMHWCMNVVAGRADDPVAILIRALQPTEGLDAMTARRAAARTERDLCSGPGKLCQAMGIDGACDGEDLVTSDRLFVERLRARAYPSRSIEVTPRIGVGYAGDWAAEPLRFHLVSQHVSRR